MRRGFLLALRYAPPSARTFIEKGITDLQKAEKGEPPSMVLASLQDPQYRHLSRIPITLVAKRKSAALYKGS